MSPNVETARLAPQSYGIAMAQRAFGGPVGVWLECTTCNRSHVIVGSRNAERGWLDAPNSVVAQVFRRHGWTGRGAAMLGAKCPSCSTKPKGATQ